MKISFSKRKLIIGISGLAFLCLAVTNALSSDLAEILENVQKDYDVAHISNQQFQKLPVDEVVVFDVRQAKEYQVSHIENALHLDPGTSEKEFLDRYADKLDGKTVVFYCSVGQRSSRMLSKLNDKLNQSGVKQAYNLEGGAFKWHNDKIDFRKDGQPTKNIHPYNAYWGRLIEDASSIKYK